MKKIINNPQRVVPEMLEGLVAQHPGLALLPLHNIVLRTDINAARDNQVALISGGGSGHEPAHAGYVGAGMLSAAVAGEVFTSPSVDSVLAAIRAVAGRPGVLLIVKNYTGDRLNFGMAAEIARAEGIAVETVIVADDVALAALGKTDARGLAGTVLIHKIAGAAAARGDALDRVAEIARAAAGDLGTIGISLSAGTAPAVGRPSFELGVAEAELGLGIHGEPGIERVALQPADEIVDVLLDRITTTLRLPPGSRLAVLLNNLGATTPMELAIAARRVFAQLTERGFLIERLYSGTFLSSLDMAGISLSLLLVDKTRLPLLDAPTSAPAWPNVLAEAPGRLSDRVWHEPALIPVPARDSEPVTGTKLERAIRAACASLREAEHTLTEMDRVAGDGDLGVNLARAANSVNQALPVYPLGDPSATLKAVGLDLQRVLGGSSGPLYGVLFLRAASHLAEGSPADSRAWAAALRAGCDAVSELGGARIGDCTMLDALIPFAESLDAGLSKRSRLPDALAAAAIAAGNGAAGTAQLVARRGRASYLGERTLGRPDPGAVAASIWLRAVVTELSSTD